MPAKGSSAVKCDSKDISTIATATAASSNILLEIKNILEHSSDAPPVHFVRIDDQELENDKSIKGHATGGPIRIAKVNKVNPLFFWCLEIHLIHYKKLLSQYGIHVFAVEHYLQAKMQEEQYRSIAGQPLSASEIQYPLSAPHFLDKIIHDVLLNAGRNKTRDRTNIKVVFVFFLLMEFERSYALDTNIYPLNQSDLEFPNDAAPFKMVYTGLPNKITREDIMAGETDIWLLYSSCSQTAKAVFSYYQKKWPSIEQGFLNNGGYTLDYHRSCAALAREALAAVCDVMEVWYCSSLHCRVTVPDLKLEKFYYLTHRPENSELYDSPGVVDPGGKIIKIISDYCDEPKLSSSMFSFLCRSNYRQRETAVHLMIDWHPINMEARARQLERMLEDGEDVNQRVMTGPYAGESLLFKAVREINIECVRVILKFNPDLNFTALHPETTKPTIAKTPYALAKDLVFRGSSPYQDSEKVLPQIVELIERHMGAATATAEQPKQLKK